VRYVFALLLPSLLFLAAAGADEKNLLPNPGFEQITPGEAGKPDRLLEWKTHLGKGKADFAAVETEPHGGKRCAHIKAHAPNPSGYWSSPRINVVGGRCYKLTVWYRARNVEFSSRGAVFLLNFRTEKHAWAGQGGEYVLPFTAGWTKLECTCSAPRTATYANAVIGLADSPGELWIDDVSLVESHDLRSDMPETDQITARPFPQYWLPNTNVGLIAGEVQPLLFLVQNRSQRKVANPSVGLLLPAGIRPVGGDAGVSPPPKGEPVERNGKKLFRWLCPVEKSAQNRKVFDYYHGSLVCLKATCAPGKYPAYYFFSSKEENQEPQATVIEVLPALPQPPKLKRFRIGFLLPDAVRAGGPALDFVDMYARTGMNAVQYGRRPTRVKELAARFRAKGILRLELLAGTGVVYDCAYGNRDPKIAPIDAEGRPNFSGLCPTYAANRGEHFEKSPLESRLTAPVRADEIDGITINWEPPGTFSGPDYCWCPRCLDAFAKETGIPRDELDTLDPKGVMKKHGAAWLRFRARLEGLIAKAYYDKCNELAKEVGREILFVPLTGPGRFAPPRPTTKDIDEAIAGGDIEHPYFYRQFIHAYGPFTYAWYDVLVKDWRGHHGITMLRARQAADFAKAQTDAKPSRPVWLGIEGVQKGSATTLCWATTPEQMELEIVGALAQGCGGVYVYTGRGMDGYFYSVAARAVRRAALLEPFVDRPLPDHAVTFSVDFPGLPPEQVARRFAYGRMFQEGTRRLLVLGGLDFQRELPVNLQLHGLAEKTVYRVGDPVTGEKLSARDVWASDTLRKGIPLKLLPGTIQTLVFEPVAD